MTGLAPALRTLMFPHIAGEADGDRAEAEPRDGTARSSCWRCVVLLLIGIIGSSGSIGMFAAIAGWERHVADLRFSSEARDRLQAINSGLNDATDLLWSMRAYFETVRHPISRAEYIAFSSALRSRVVGLRDTGWAPRVAAAERDAFERDVRASGAPDFQILERNADGKLVRAADRAEYFPVLYSDPAEINRPILGFDLASESTRNAVLERARATDRAAATPPVRLVNMLRPNGGLLGVIPVHLLPAPAPVSGFILGAFETEAMIRNILATKT
jgi:diguanylate cyclase